jgi:hypothetical protein
MLTDFGCDEAQGFYYGMPVTGEQLIADALDERADTIPGQSKTSLSTRIPVSAIQETADARN